MRHRVCKIAKGTINIPADNFNVYLPLPVETLLMPDKSGSKEMHGRNLTPLPAEVVEDVTGAGLEQLESVPPQFSTDATEFPPEAKHSDKSALQLPYEDMIGSAQDVLAAPIVVNECVSADGETKSVPLLLSAVKLTVDAELVPTYLAQEVDNEAKSVPPPVSAEVELAPDVKVETESSPSPLCAEMAQHVLQTKSAPLSFVEVAQLLPGTELASKSAASPLSALPPEVAEPKQGKDIEVKSAPPSATVAELPSKVDNEVKDILSSPPKCAPDVEPQVRDSISPPLAVVDKSVGSPKLPCAEPSEGIFEVELEAKSVPCLSPLHSVPEAERGGKHAPHYEVSGCTQDAKFEENSARQAEVEKTTDVVQFAEDGPSAKGSTIPKEMTTEAGLLEEIACGESISVSNVVDQEIEEVRQQDLKVSVDAVSPPGLDEMPTFEPVAQEEMEAKNAPPLNDETWSEGAATGDIVSLISHQNVRLDAENKRLRDEIQNIQDFCQTQGMQAPPPCQEATFGKLLLSQQQNPSDRNGELRAEHEYLRSTLGGFCKGLTELADQLSTAMSAAQRTEQFGEAV